MQLVCQAPYVMQLIGKLHLYQALFKRFSFGFFGKRFKPATGSNTIIVLWALILLDKDHVSFNSPVKCSKHQGGAVWIYRQQCAPYSTA